MESRRRIIKEAKLKQKIRELIKGEVRVSEPMSGHTSFHIGGPADIFVIPHDQEDLKNILIFTSKKGIPLFILGEGTNLLVRDRGIRGVVIKLSENFARIRFEGEKGLIGAGAKLVEVIEASIENGLSGLEFFSGIPGSIGGAVVMNAGTNSQAIGEVIKKVKVCSLKGETFSLSKEELGFGYRKSIFQEETLLILEVEFFLRKGEKKKICQTQEEILEKRKKNQPLFSSNAGCIFKNPKSDSAGRLIELAGLKGREIGGAQVSFEHANFILNLGQAKAGEVIELIREIEKVVKKKTGIELEREIRIVGE